jgi:hypothetical protein
MGISGDVYIMCFIEFWKSRGDTKWYEAKKKHINNFFTRLNMFSMGIIQVLMDAAVSYKDGIVIK